MCGIKTCETLLVAVEQDVYKRQALVTAADVTHSKPHPEPYLTGARKAGVDPADCVVFEDSFQGLESGRRAGAFVVGIATTNPAESLEGKADLIVGSLAELINRL